VAELRWILLGLGLLLIGGIWWRGTRGTSQASKDADARDTAPILRATGGAPRAGAGDVGAHREPVLGEDFDDSSPRRERAVPPFEPLTIKTTDFDRLPILDTPFLAETRTRPEPRGAGAAGESNSAPDRDFDTDTDADADAAHADAAPADAADPPAPAEASPSAVAPAADAESPPAAPEPQKIVTLRIIALGDALWPGKKLAEALEMQGLAYGRYQVFHRNHVDGRSMFCVASLLEPGIFDLQSMPAQEFRGVIAFAVLPGPLEPVQTIEAMLATARRLAESLTGMVQDAKGLPLSPQRAATLREEVARFQATLS